MTTHSQQLHQAGELLREEQPVLWALIRGRGGEARIAWLLGWSSRMVKRELESLRKQGMVTLNKQGTTWSLTDGEKYAELNHLYHQLEVKVSQEYPSTPYGGSVSLKTQKYLDTAREVLKGSRSTMLSDSQLKSLMKIHELMGDEQFNTTELTKALGYSTSRSYMTRSQLEALAKKGHITLIPDLKPGHWWQLTPQGIETAQGDREVETKADRPRRIQGAAERARGMNLGLLEKAPQSTAAIAEARGISRSAAHKAMTRYAEEGLVGKTVLPDGSNVWFLK